MVVGIALAGATASCAASDAADLTSRPPQTGDVASPAQDAADLAPAPQTAAASQADTDAADESATPTDTSSPLDEATFPLTVIDETGAEIVVTSIERIIPLDGDVAEVVFALGLGDHVVATDLSATYPPEADALPEIGYQRALSAETIASHAPTLLLATDLAGPPEALDDLRRLGYPLVIIPNEATPDGAGRKIRAVARALGVAVRGEVLADAVDAAIAEASVPPQAAAARPRVLALYVRGTVAQLVFGESMNTHWLIEAAGGIDVGAAMGVRENAPISAEAILAAAPDVLLVPAAGLDSVGGIDGLLAIGALGQTPAGQHRQVLVYDDQLLLGNGPRTGEVLRHLADDLRSVVIAEPSVTTTDHPSNDH